MVEVYDDEGRALLLRLLAAHPEWESGLEAGCPSDVPFQTVHPRLCIPSEHPEIRTPLTIELGGTLQLFWYCGYFFDFLGREQATDAFEFLQKFFAEEIRCGTCWLNGKVVAGGPEWGVGDPAWPGEYDRLEVRSWRGNRDDVVER